MVQGVLLFGLQKFVRERFGESLWQTIQHEAGIAGRVYLPSHSYPGEDLVALAAGLSRHSGMSTQLVLESFGDALAEDLIRLYAAEIDPRWKLFDVLAKSDELIERISARAGEALARSPIAGRWSPNGEVILTYRSALPLCAMLKGVVRGVGAMLEQPVTMDEQRCMAMGASSCEFTVRLEREQKAPLGRRLTSPPIGDAAVKAAMLGERSTERPSAPPSIPPSGVRAAEPGTIPPASGVTTTKSTPLDDGAALGRRR